MKHTPEANAKLIAAAPDLLEACQVLFNQLNSINTYLDDDSMDDFTDGYPEFLLDAIKDIDLNIAIAGDAIKKATE